MSPVSPYTRARLTIEVAICTLGADGISSVARMLPSQSEGVRYLVSWQGGKDIEVPRQLAVRDDVRVIRCAGTGLSANRNHALDHAEGDIILIADDDLVYHEGAFEAVRQAFETHPELEYASFRHDGPGERIYPDVETRLVRKLPPNFVQTSFEVALRRDSRAATLRYNEDFGLGSGKYMCGEEELLLRKAIANGMECRFFPITIVTHPDVSTGFREEDRMAVNMVRGVLTVIDHPWSWPVRTAVRCWRNGGMRGVINGFVGALETCLSPEVRRYVRS